MTSPALLCSLLPLTLAANHPARCGSIRGRLQHTLGAIVQVTCPQFKGPHLGGPSLEAAGDLVRTKRTNRGVAGGGTPLDLDSMFEESVLW